MGGSGGGHGSGSVEYPEWFGDEAGEFLASGQSYSVAALADNPYEDVSAYNPVAYIGRMNMSAEGFRDVVEGVDYIGIGRAVIAEAERLADESNIMASDADIGKAVEEFSGRQDLDIARRMARLESGYNSINAVNSSSFVIARALLEMEGSRQVAEFNANATLQSKQFRMQFIHKAYDVFLAFFTAYLEANKAGAMFDLETSKVQLVAEKERHDRDLLINSKERIWPLQVHQYWANYFAGLGGGSGMATQEWENHQEKSGIFGWGTFLL